MKIRVLAAGALSILGGAFCSHAAFGQNEAVAQALFDEGKRLNDQGKAHEACLKFAASQREEPALGTLLRLAICDEEDGRKAKAWAEFRDAAAQAERRQEKGRAIFAKEHASLLEGTLHWITITMAAPPPDLRLKLDGGDIDAAVLGTPMALDPGDHSFEASARGKRTWACRLSVARAGREWLDIPSLVEDRPLPVADERRRQETSPLPSSSGLPDDSTTKRTVAFAAGATGIALLGVATALQVTALSYDDKSRRPAPGQDPQALYDKASSNQTYAEVAGVLGTVGVASSLFLLLVPWPRSWQGSGNSSFLDLTLHADARGAAVALKGSFQ
jgi:hypothetical protein